MTAARDAKGGFVERKPDGWALVTARGMVTDFRPRVREFFGAVLDDDAPEFDAEELARIDRDWAGLAPHRCAEVFFAAPAHSVAEALADPRLQQAFGDAIEGALAFGFQGNNQPPEGHWLWRFWSIGRAEATKAQAPTVKESLSVANQQLTTAPADVLTEDQWLDLAERHAWADFSCEKPDGYLNAVKALCRDFAAHLRAAPVPTEPMTRFCPGCGSVGKVEGKFRDCCPDGGKARNIPEPLAQHCHDLFQLAIRGAYADDDDTPAAAALGKGREA